MHKNLLWRAFLAVVLGCAFWYSAWAVYLYYAYSHLDASIPAASVKWEVEKSSEEMYFLKGTYLFDYQGVAYEGSTVLKDEPFRNAWAAEEAAKEFAGHPVKVWFDAEYPDHSSLQKTFPLKECIYAVSLWGLLIYFFLLGFYVTKFKG